MTAPRASGVLLHPTSLPDAAFDGGCLDAGSGDFGSAHAFVDWLAAAGQSLWQVLPLHPPGPGDSPYTSVSVHAGHPGLVSPLALVEAGWLRADEVAPARRATGPTHARADFERGARLRDGWLRAAAARFRDGARREDKDAWRAWCESQRGWLDDYALFMALRDRDGRPWTAWPRPLARRDPAALAEARRALAPAIDDLRFVQWCFATQWDAVRAHARSRGVRVVGDLPIYVAHDSADVWAAPQLFDLDDDGRPRAVAGVPPDYFSATGQLWGNPLYRWDRHAGDGYAWWSARLASSLRHADLVRIDHFRGFASYWEVPRDAPDATGGRWRPGPGLALFDALERSLGVARGDLPLIAEDLGLLTPDVPALIAATGLPCMRVLQFGFGGDANDLNLPHRYPEACAAYSGTHDNDTTLGWFAHASADARRQAQVYLASDGREIGWDFIHAVSASVARYAFAPMQDVLGLGGEARMNRPGVADGQWRWRFDWSAVADWQGRRLAEIAAAHGRRPR